MYIECLTLLTYKKIYHFWYTRHRLSVCIIAVPPWNGIIYYQKCHSHTSAVINYTSINRLSSDTPPTRISRCNEMLYRYISDMIINEYNIIMLTISIFITFGWSVQLYSEILIDRHEFERCPSFISFPKYLGTNLVLPFCFYFLPQVIIVIINIVQLVLTSNTKYENPTRPYFAFIVCISSHTGNNDSRRNQPQ